MFVWNFELQTVLLLASLLPLIGAILALGWHTLQRRQYKAADQASLLTPLLAQAPIGFLLFDQAHQLIQNNASARTLLHLPVDAITLPESRWATLLREDLLKQGHSRTLEIAKPLVLGYSTE